MGLTDEMDEIDMIEALGIAPLRFEIIRQLRGGRMSVTQLMERTGLCRSAVNSHLRVLGRAALVEKRAVVVPYSAKPVAYYRLDDVRLQDELRRLADDA